MKLNSYPKKCRLLKRDDFDIVREHGSVLSNTYFRLGYYERKDGHDETRLGIIVTKKFGKAVKRNRAKRLIRESFRLVNSQLAKGFNLVVVVRMRAEKLNYESFDSQLKELLRKSGILNAV